MNTNAVTVADSFLAMSTAGSTNTSALTAIASIVDTLTEPATSLSAGRFVNASPPGGLCLVALAGIGADNDTGTVRILTWHKFRLPGSDVVQYVPRIVFEGSIVLGTRTGIAGGVLGTTYRWVDTITPTNDGGLNTSRVRIIGRDGSGASSDTGTGASGAANVADQCPAWIAFDRLNADYVEVQTRGTGTTTTILPFLTSMGGG